jgi:DNA-binding response OmpR family regulator
VPNPRYRLLAVDDDPDTLELLDVVLSAAGYDVLPALDGPEGLSLLHRGSPDVVLLDLQMPGISGVEILERMRAARPEVPIVVVSGQADVEVARAVLRRGAVDYVKKPVRPDHLLQVIAAALGVSLPGNPVARP